MWKSSVEINRLIDGFEEIDRLTDVHALSTYWGNAVFPKDYCADPEWPNIVALSSEGEQVFEEHKQLISGAQPSDLLLALFRILAHHDLLIDWKRSDIHAITLLLERELLAEKIRLPFRFGRVLYDRFNDVYHSNRTDHLVPDDTRQLLEGTPQGVYQLNRYVSGPLGILEADEPRWIPPGLALPLWHCSDTGCSALHNVYLMPSEIPVRQAFQTLNQNLMAKYGPPSEWQFVLDRLHCRNGWITGRPYYDLPVVIGDCFLDEERTKLLVAALMGPHSELLRKALSRSPRKKSDGSGPAAELASRLSPAAQLELLMLMSDAALIELLDSCIDNQILKIPLGEVRSAKLRPPTIRHRDSRTEVSSLGVRSPRENPIVHLSATVWRAYEHCGLMTELEWRVHGDSGRPLKETFVAFIRDRGPLEALKELVLASGAVTQAVCADLETSIAHASPHQPIGPERLLWKLGFDPMQFDDSIRRFRSRLKDFNECVLETTPVQTEDDREKIRSIGVNLFVSVEDFLDRLISFNVWLLASDHFLETKYWFDISKARYVVPMILGDQLDIGSTKVTWSVQGENSLGVLFRYLSESVKWMESLDEVNRDQLLRPDEDLPHFAEDRYRPFPFRHKQLWADTDVSGLRNYREGYRSIARLLEQANVAEVRNGLDHYREGHNFPGSDALLACVARLQQTLELADVHRFFPKAFWLHRWTEDRFGMTQYECLDYANRMVQLYGPLLVSGLPKPDSDTPMLIAPGNLLGLPHSTLGFHLREKSKYSTYWDEYPRKRQVPPPESMISKEF
jgi:hypothetical protein